MAIIGIDLGTTNSLVSVWTKEGVKLIPNSFGEYLTPSVVSFSDHNEIYVGKVAKERLITNPNDTFKEFKCTMGTSKTYLVKKTYLSYTSEELSALVLKQLKEDAESYLGEKVEEAVISVPAYFNDEQRAATRNAGLLAGLKVDRLINEPSAAALSRRMSGDKQHKVMMIFDFGGGTLDVSIVDSFENIVEIQSVAGDNHLGGKNFNDVIVQSFCKDNSLEFSLLGANEKEMIYREAELCKMQLSTSNEVTRTIMIEEKQYILNMTNQKLIESSADIFLRMVKPIERAINNIDMELEDIDDLILVGGSTKMPIVRQYIKSLFHIEVMCDDNPDEIVGMGAGIVAGIKARKEDVKDMILSDICPFSLGVEIKGDIFSTIIERNSILPCSKSSVYTTTKDGQSVIEIPVYQGEKYKASDNTQITRIRTKIPPAPAGSIGIEVRFTYDINGIFEIDVRGLNFGLDLHKTIITKKNGMTQEEINQKTIEMQKLKIAPREIAENKYALEMAQRLYEEGNSQEKLIIGKAITQFEQILQNGNDSVIKQSLVKFMIMLEQIDKAHCSIHADLHSFWEDEFINEDSNDAGKDH